MMNKILTSIFVTSMVFSSVANSTEYLTLLTDRSSLHVDPLVKLFEQEYDAKVSVIYTKEGTIRSRISDSTVDIVYATEVTEMEEIESNLTKLKMDTKSINPELVSKDKKWISPSYRIRGAYHKEDTRVSTWDDLKSKKVCIRPMTHPYNISLFQALSKEKIHIEQFIIDFNSSVQKPTSGNDRKQAQFMHEGKCDVAVLNSYYVKVMNSDSNYKEIVQGKKFTPLTVNGKYVALQSAVAVVKDSEINHKFVDFMLKDKAQEFITTTVGEYSYRDNKPIVTASHLNTRKQMFEMIQNGSK